MRIQEYLICAIQNIQALISHVYRPNRKAGVMAAKGGNFSIGLSSCLIAQLISDALKIDIQGDRYYETLCMEEAER
jgi:phosphosulfolactate phosphohydrolase-like enzyme